jgi:hypothetical protein
MLTEELIDKLQTSEWEELKRFMRFRFPRLREDVYRMVDALKDSKAKNIDLQHLYNKLFPKTQFNDKTIRYLLTDVNKAIYEYFGYKQLQKQPNKQQLLLLNELTDRKCERAFSKSFNILMSEFDNAAHSDAQSLLYYSEVLGLKARVELESGQRSSDAFELSALYMDQYFVARKLQISAEKINLNYILKKDWEDPFLEIILQQIDNGMFSSVPYIQLYRLIIISLTEPENESAFISMKAQVSEIIDSLPASEITDLYQYLLNYCIRKINAGRLQFQDELLAVYQSALKHGALLTNGKISQWDFKNVVTIALRTGSTDYAREFIHSYKQALPSSQRTNALAYNLANLHFSENNYRAAISQLQKVDLDDVFYRLDARSILLKSYYELDDQDALFYHSAAFRSMLNRNRKISDQQRKLYLNLIKHTLSLSRSGGEKSKVRAIKKHIADKPNVADLRWLEQKVSELLA